MNFKEQIFEIAFGFNAINRDFSEEEVIKKIEEYSNNALKWENENEEIEENEKP